MHWFVKIVGETILVPIRQEVVQEASGSADQVRNRWNLVEGSAGNACQRLERTNRFRDETNSNCLPTILIPSSHQRKLVLPWG